MSDTISTTKANAELEAEAAERKQRARIPLPQAGEGLFVYFSLRDLTDIDRAFTPKMLAGEYFFGALERMLLGGQPEVFRGCLDVGLKREGDDGKPVPVTIDLDDPDFTMSEATPAILNALAWAIHRKSYDDLLAEAIALHARVNAGAADEAGEAE